MILGVSRNWWWLYIRPLVHSMASSIAKIMNNHEMLGALSSGQKKLGWPDWYMLANFTPNRPQACFSQNGTCLRHPIDGDLIFSFSWLWRKQTNWLIDGGMMKELLSEQNHLQRLLWPRGSWWMCDYVNLAINGWNIGHQKSCCGPVLSGCVSKWSIYLKYLSIEYA